MRRPRLSHVASALFVWPWIIGWYVFVGFLIVAFALALLGYPDQLSLIFDR